MATDLEKLVEKMKGQKNSDQIMATPNIPKDKNFPNIKNGAILDKGILRDFDKEKRQDLNIDGTFLPIPSPKQKPNADGTIPLKKGGRTKKIHPNW